MYKHSVSSAENLKCSNPDIVKYLCNKVSVNDIEWVVTSQFADGPTRRRIKSSRDVGELVINPIQLMRS